MKLQMMFLFAAACSASVDGNNPGGGGGGGGGDDEGVGNDDIRFRLTAIADERADVVDFASGEPVHTHAKPQTQLGAADCPDVYKHAYLMDVAAPPFGREVAPNPLAWTIEAAGPAEYRLRSEATTLRDWTAVAGDTIELRRDVVTSGKHLLDVRVGDSVATTCFMFHPLAAPLEALAPTPAPAGLAAMSFAAGSPISRLLGDEFVPVFTQRFAHHTAESIDLVIDATKPVATYDRRAVDDYIALPPVGQTTVCYDANGPTNAPICTDASAIPTTNIETAGGPLTTGYWAMRILDEATNAVTANCTLEDLRATCRLPARAPTGATQRYRAELYVANLPQLAPFGNPGVGELVLDGRAFTGRILETQKRCAEFRDKTIGGVDVRWCIKEAHHVHMQAMDTAKLTFAPQTLFTLTTTTPTPFPQSGFTWDAGDADLPGAQ